MSDAYNCDRCGDFDTGSPPSTIKTFNSKDGVPVLGDGDRYLPKKTIELCADCSMDFRYWMGDGDE